MSNFSNIGFRVTTQEELQHLLEKVYRTSTPIKIDEGVYYVFTDSSGAELYIQFNTKNKFLGVNPHFKGKSKRTVFLTNSVLRSESELDGAFIVGRHNQKTIIQIVVHFLLFLTYQISNLLDRLTSQKNLKFSLRRLHKN